jgi:hypothetical protein
LILTVVFSLFTTSANENVSMFNILKEYFYVRTKDASIIEEGSEVPIMGKGVYEFKFKKEVML